MFLSVDEFDDYRDDECEDTQRFCKCDCKDHGRFDLSGGRRIPSDSSKGGESDQSDGDRRTEGA